MLIRKCDRCKKEISNPIHKAVESAIYTLHTETLWSDASVDLCSECSKQFDEMAKRWMKGKK